MSHAYMINGNYVDAELFAETVTNLFAAGWTFAPPPADRLRPAVGEVIHGFAGGYFGRDSYGCRRVEAVGPDWIVTRKIARAPGEPDLEFVSGTDIRGAVTAGTKGSIGCYCE